MPGPPVTQPVESSAFGVATELAAVMSANRPSAWTTPYDLPAVRSALTETLETNVPFTAPLAYPPVDLTSLRASVDRARIAASRLDPMFREVILRDLQAIVDQAEVLACRDDGRLAAFEAAEDRQPDPGVLQEARRIVAATTDPADPPPTLDAPALQDRLAGVLARYGISGWSVEINANMAARMSVVGTKRLLKVRADLAITDAEGERLVVHEVGGHVLRWVNAAEQPEPLAALPLGETVATEEGLAALVEEELGVSQPGHLRTYALRVLAVHAGRTRSLVGLARHLTTWLAPQEAADLAVRVRRGFVHPDAVGARTKDHGYLTGLMALRQLAVDPDDLALLRVTKWPMTWLPLMRHLRDAGRLRSPRLVPDPVLLLGAEHRRTGIVTARRLDADRAWTTDRGTPMQSRAGDWWVTTAGGETTERGVAAAEFDNLYEPLGEGRFSRKDTVVAVRVRAPLMVASLEGTDVAHPGDWVVQQGGSDHRWVVPHGQFISGYTPV